MTLSSPMWKQKGYLRSTDYDGRSEVIHIYIPHVVPVISVIFQHVTDMSVFPSMKKKYLEAISR